MVIILSVYDMQYKRTAYLSNDTEKGIHYQEDKLTTSIPDGIYTLSLKIPKDTLLVGAIDIGYYIETRTRQGKLLLMAITEMDEDSKYKNIYCVDSSILVVNNFIEAIEEPKTAEQAEYYVQHALKNSDVELKVVASTEAKLVKYGSEQRVLARLQAIANEFDLELSFDTEFIPGQVPKRYVSLLKKRVEDYEGFRVSSDDFLLGVERKKSMINVATKMRVRGKQKPTTTQTSAESTAPTPTPTPEPAKDTFIETAIERAFEIKKLGRRYQWGGNGNPSWDCSGYMQEVFKAAGKTIDHRWTTYTMWAQQGGHFKRISKSELKRGDMIMYDTGYTHTKPNHVGLYLGPSLSSPNSVIHAGDPVGLTQRADSMTIIGYVRVVRPRY